MSVSATADELGITSREFFEHAKMKMAYSIIFSAGSMMLLGFAAIAGGEANGYGDLRDAASTNSAVTDNVKNSYGALASGYGFACFVFMVGFILLLAAAIYVSPAACGSANEKLTIKRPIEINAAH